MSFCIDSKVGRLDGIRFSVLGDEDIVNMSCVEVTSIKQIRGNSEPYEQGIYDSNMGAIFKIQCKSCNNQIDKCPGHPGHYRLRWPLMHPFYKEAVEKWIKLICRKCARIVVDVDLCDDFSEFVASTDRAGTEVIKYLVTKLNKRAANGLYCDHCSDIKTQMSHGVFQNSKFNRAFIHPSYRVSDASEHFLELGVKKNDIKKEEGKKRMLDNLLFTPDILAIFEGLADGELDKIGLDARFHPRHYICRNLYIPPINLRFINNSKKSMERCNNVSANLEEVISSDMKLPADIGSGVSRDFGQLYEKHSIINDIVRLHDAYNKYIGVRDSKNEAPDGLYASAKEKDGLIKRDMIGKNVGKAFRLVIACDTKIQVDVTLVSQKVARTITVEETVTPYNIKNLAMLASNGNIYPGCPRVWSIESGRQKINNGDHVLVCGDIVHRHLLKGDEVTLNRSPSLVPTSTTLMKIGVCEGKEDINYIGLNVLSCALSNADFDGDTMTGKVYSKEHTREEASILMTMDRFLTQFEDSSPIIGQVQDSVLGMSLMTAYGTILSKLEAMRLFRNIPVTIKLTKKTYTGRELLSMIMPNINYRAPSPMFKDPMIWSHGSYDESDREIVIEDGVVISGIFCGDVIKPAKDSIYHVIKSIHGASVMLNTIFQHQQLSKAFMEINGSTISYGDFRLSADSRKMIDLVQDGIMREYSEMNNKILTNSLVPPHGTELADFIEEESCRILNPGNKYLAAIMMSIKPKENWLLQMIYSSTNGGPSNFFNIFAPVGQLKIEGKRLQPTLDTHRASIHHRQFSLNPQSMGYIHTSYLDGIESSSTLFTGTETRRNVLTKSIGTALGGVLGKVIMRMSESCVVDYRLFTVRGYGKNIIEFNNTGDGFKSSALLLNEYMAPKLDLSIYGDRASVIKSEMERVDLIQKQLRSFNIYHKTDKFSLPINIHQLVGDPTEPHSEKITKVNLKLLDDFCDNLFYCRINRVHRAKKTPLPRMMTCPFELMSILLRSNITPAHAAGKTTDEFKLLLAYIEHMIIKGFFSPGDPIGLLMGQSETAPLTQFLIDAHHNSASGGTPKDKLNYQTEIISGKSSKEATVCRMTVFLKPQYEKSLDNIQKLASYITSKRLSDIILQVEILFENHNEHIIHPEDKIPADKFMATMASYSSKAYNKFKFRYVFSQSLMSSKAIKIEDICNKIEHVYHGDINLVYYASEHEIVLLMYFVDGFTWGQDKVETDGWDKVFAFSDKLVDNLTINEFDGIVSTEVKSVGGIYFIETKGVNLREVLLIDCVDDTRTSCNNAIDTFHSEGLIACKMKVMSELKNTFEGKVKLGISNYSLMSSLIIETGSPTPITEVGQKKREGDDLLLRVAVKDPRKPLTEAALNCMSNQMTSMSAHTMLGQTPRHLGTNFSRVLVNEEFVRENTKKNDLLDLI